MNNYTIGALGEQTIEEELIKEQTFQQTAIRKELQELKQPTRNNPKLKGLGGKHAVSIQDHISTRISTHHINTGASFYQDKNTDLDLTGSSY